MNNQNLNTLSPIISRHDSRLSKWVSLVTKLVVTEDGRPPAEFHSLAQADYVSVFAISKNGRIPLVRQYRSAVERYTYEFPGGILDRNDSPEAIAISEVEEETGYRVIGKPMFLGCMAPDTGRLENRFWGFFGETEPAIESGWVPERGIEVLLVTKLEFRKMIESGQFDHALHIALIGLALTRGLFSWEK